MNNLLKTLYGSFKVITPLDWLMIPIKFIYLIYSLPFLIFAWGLNFKSGGFFGSPADEKVGPIKKVLIHIAALFWATVLWGSIVMILDKKFNIKIL